ncbi:hypothetical protein [Rhizobium leguminosarum]|uniref:hypothetical protein n=1 Tax=Rhizobium leguminosarum TaxID=384 RepID=UPI001C94802C|nr:hypothetical protein [Rhizobium leguminosarum]MBY5426997.1 hypothetical protein [Rhizobium leguminosarum]
MSSGDGINEYVNPSKVVPELGARCESPSLKDCLAQVEARQLLVGLYRSHNDQYDVATVIRSEQRAAEMEAAGHHLVGLYVVPQANVELLQSAERSQANQFNRARSEVSRSALLRKTSEHLRLAGKLSALADTEMLRLGAVSVFDDYRTGQFSNLDRIDLRWCAPDWFEYIPNEDAHFYFTKPNAEQVSPGRLFTDGGSIPKLFTFAKNLSPWGYLPAFLLHDWQFDLHHSGASGESFESVRDTMMEALKTLMVMGTFPRSELDFNLIYVGINSSIARDVWNSAPGLTLPSGATT